MITIEDVKELAKTVAPVLIAWIGLLRTRHDVDVLWARQRDPVNGEKGPCMRRRWYSVLKRRRKSPADKEET